MHKQFLSLSSRHDETHNRQGNWAKHRPAKLSPATAKIRESDVVAQHGQRIDKTSDAASRKTNELLDFGSRVAPADVPPFSKQVFLRGTIRPHESIIRKPPVFI